MQLQFRCMAWPDPVAVQRRLGEVVGLGSVQLDADGHGLTVESSSAQSARQAEVRLLELGWRQMH